MRPPSRDLSPLATSLSRNFSSLLHGRWFTRAVSPVAFLPREENPNRGKFFESRGFATAAMAATKKTAVEEDFSTLTSKTSLKETREGDGRPGEDLMAGRTRDKDELSKVMEALEKVLRCYGVIADSETPTPIEIFERTNKYIDLLLEMEKGEKEKGDRSDLLRQKF